MSYAIVTPIWKECLTDAEFQNIAYTCSKVSDVDHYFIFPIGMNLEYYKKNFKNCLFKGFDPSSFKNIQNYNRLMLTSSFYKAFETYKGIVICQTDAIMLRALPERVFDFDYLGAPWMTPFRLNRARILGWRKFGWLLSILYIGELVFVGNGGLSWRKIDAFLNIEKHIKNSRISNPAINEDLVISYLGAKGLLNIPSRLVAEKVFVECDAVKMLNFDQVVGFHALEKFNPDLRKTILTTFS